MSDTTFGFSQSIALATEMVNSLLCDSFIKWYNSRLDLAGGTISDVYPNDEEVKILKNRVKQFSKSLKGLHIMKISGDSMQHSSMGSEVIRKVIFDLGNSKDIPLVTVEIFVTSDPEPHEDSIGANDIWKSWEPMYEKSIVCIQHSNPKFQNFIVFGTDAIDNED